MTAAANNLSHSLAFAGAMLVSGQILSSVSECHVTPIPGAVELPPFMPTATPSSPCSEPFSLPRRPQVQKPTPARRSKPALACPNRDQQIESNLHLVESLVSELYAKCGNALRGLERDDLIQEGRIGLIEAVDSYNPTKGASFKTHAYRCIKDALSDCLKANGRQTQLFEQVLGEVEDHSPLHKESVGTNLRSDLQDALDTLDDREREAILLHVVDQHSKAETARRLGMSRQGCGELIERATRKMRGFLAPTWDES